MSSREITQTHTRHLILIVDLSGFFFFFFLKKKKSLIIVIEVLRFKNKGIPWNLELFYREDFNCSLVLILNKPPFALFFLKAIFKLSVKNKKFLWSTIYDHRSLILPGTFWVFWITLPWNSLNPIYSLEIRIMEFATF